MMKKVDIFNWIGNYAIENKLKNGDKIHISIKGEELCIAEMIVTESKDIEFNITKNYKGAVRQHE